MDLVFLELAVEIFEEEGHFPCLLFSKKKKCSFHTAKARGMGVLQLISDNDIVFDHHVEEIFLNLWYLLSLVYSRI